MSAITHTPELAQRLNALAAPLGRVPQSRWIDDGSGRAIPDPNPQKASALLAATVAGRTLTGAEQAWLMQFLTHAIVAVLGGAHVILHETKTENAP